MYISWETENLDITENFHCYLKSSIIVAIKQNPTVKKMNKHTHTPLLIAKHRCPGRRVGITKSLELGPPKVVNSVTKDDHKSPKVHDLWSRNSSLAHGHDHETSTFATPRWSRPQVASLVNLARGHGRQVDFCKRQPLKMSWFVCQTRSSGPLCGVRGFRSP